jgi:hypothetical protein
VSWDVEPRTAAGRELLDILSYPVRQKDREAMLKRILDIEAEMYDLASNDGYHQGIADAKEHLRISVRPPL